MALKTSLVGVWELNEASGNALDSFGSRTLTETVGSGSIGSGAGPASLTGARTFTRANSQYFTVNDDAGLSTGDIDFTVSCWANFTALGGTTQIALSRDNVSANREWALFYSGGAGRFQFGVSSNGTNLTTVSANTFGAPSISTWYFIAAWHDSVNNLLGISVNGTADTSAYASGGFDSAAPFRIGAHNSTPANFIGGSMAQVAYWKNRVVNSTDLGTIYATGSGLPYSSWDAGAFDAATFPYSLSEVPRTPRLKAVSYGSQ